MREASSRVLVDRTTLRVDGHAFFAFGPRLRLTPAQRFAETLAEIASLGFNSVGSPPASPGTISLIHRFLDAADAAGLMALLCTEPRLHEHSGYLAEEFCSYKSLLAYLLPPIPGREESLRSLLAERDSLRAADLFHPIAMPLSARHHLPQWLRAQDIYCPITEETEFTDARPHHQHPGPGIERLRKATEKLQPRPMLCTDLRTFPPDRDRVAGLYSEDPAVSDFPPAVADWFPWLTDMHERQRRDMLSPSPELLRLQVYDLLAAGVRGIFLDFHEAMLGEPPCCGRDRLAEASILAQEIQVFHEFFAEGRLETEIEIESGHPRLDARIIRHGHELLVILRMEGYEDDYFIDEARLERTEVTLKLPGGSNYTAWRMDFPGARRLQVHRDAKGAMRFQAGALELTALILLTTGAQRSEDLANRLRDRLPAAADRAVQCAAVRFSKVTLIEGELARQSSGVDNYEILRSAQEQLNEAKSFLATESYTDAWSAARNTGRLLRLAIKYQMARALGTPVFDRAGLRAHLCKNYFTLPRFYREGAVDTARAFMDLT